MSRIYTIHDPVCGELKYKCKCETLCVFCSHCTDVFWDYSHGPYMVICDLSRPETEEHNYRNTCKDFDDDYEEEKHE